MSNEYWILLVCFLFRKALQDIRFLPYNPFTEWIDIDRQKTEFRISVLNVTIDDLNAFYHPVLFDCESIADRFERTYAHLKLEFPCFFQDYNEDMYYLYSVLTRFSL